jgi:hypothetical protein
MRQTNWSLRTSRSSPHEPVCQIWGSFFQVNSAATRGPGTNQLESFIAQFVRVLYEQHNEPELYQCESDKFQVARKFGHILAVMSNEYINESLFSTWMHYPKPMQKKYSRPDSGLAATRKSVTYLLLSQFTCTCVWQCIMMKIAGLDTS